MRSRPRSRVAELSVRLLLFAQAREAAGRAHDDFDAATLGDLLGVARATYGEQFTAVLANARVWVNGDDPTDGDATRLTSGDEVAVIPPVSGGGPGMGRRRTRRQRANQRFLCRTSEKSSKRRATIL